MTSLAKYISVYGREGHVAEQGWANSKLVCGESERNSRCTWKSSKGRSLLEIRSPQEAPCIVYYPLRFFKKYWLILHSLPGFRYVTNEYKRPLGKLVLWLLKANSLYLCQKGSVHTSKAWWFTSAIPTLGRLRQNSHRFEGHLGYKVRLCLNSLISTLPGPNKKKRNSYIFLNRNVSL